MTVAPYAGMGRKATSNAADFRRQNDAISPCEAVTTAGSGEEKETKETDLVAENVTSTIKDTPTSGFLL